MKRDGAEVKDGMTGEQLLNLVNRQFAMISEKTDVAKDLSEFDTLTRATCDLIRSLSAMGLDWALEPLEEDKAYRRQTEISAQLRRTEEALDRTDAHLKRVSSFVRASVIICGITIALLLAVMIIRLV